MTYPSGVGVYPPKVRESSIVRKFVSQNGSGYLALGTFNGQNPVDPDTDTVSLTLWYNSTDPNASYTDLRGEIVLQVDDHTGDNKILKDGVGKFSFNIGPEHTRLRGVLTAEWVYQVSGEEFHFTDFLQVLDQMPMYDQLTEQSKYVIESVTWLFSDLFDSTNGGAWLGENFQTHWTPERLAYLMEAAIGRVNLTGQPTTNYSIFTGQKSIPKEWTPLLTWALRLEVIRHLMRSYTEIPDFKNMNVTYTDRRDYAQRWKVILDDEKPDLDKAIVLAKRSLLSLARGALLVSGGIYGPGGGGMFMSGLQVSAQRAFRFYPAAPAISFPNQGNYIRY